MTEKIQAPEGGDTLRTAARQALTAIDRIVNWDEAGMALTENHIADVEASAEALRAALAAQPQAAHRVLANCRPFVAFAFDQGIVGAEEAGIELDAFMAAAAADRQAQAHRVTPAGFTPEEWTRRVLRHALEAIEAGANAAIVMNVEGVKSNIRALLAAQPVATLPAPAEGDELCERICEAIHAADDKSMAEAGYMLDCNDCCRIVRDQFAASAPQPKGTAAQAKPEAFDSEGMRKLATIVTPFAGEAILQCVDEVDRLRAAQAAPAPALTDMQIDKLLHALDDIALNFGDDLPGLALNSRGLERSRDVVRRAFASPAVVAGPTDTERLDWLQQRGATVHLLPAGHDGSGQMLHAFCIGGLHRAVSKDMREAIDAAMGEAKPPVQHTKEQL